MRLSWIRFSLLCAVLTCNVGPLLADDEFNIDELRRALAQAPENDEAEVVPLAEEKPAQQNELEAANDELRKKEAELLARFGKVKEQAPVHSPAVEAASARSTQAEDKTFEDIAREEASAAETTIVDEASHSTITVSVGAPEPAEQIVEDEQNLDSEAAPVRAKQAAPAKTKGKNDQIKIAKATREPGKATVGSQLETIHALQKANTDLTTKLNASEESGSRLLKEVDDLRNRLIIAETEVERLSRIIEIRNMNASAPKAAVAASRGASSSQPQVQAASAGRVAQTADEMAVATVMVDKAHLRTGPGPDNSPLMAVTRGTRLAVETKRGDWYRVITPTGSRAWVAANVVAFGTTPQGAPTKTVKIGGYDSSADQQPF